MDGNGFHVDIGVLESAAKVVTGTAGHDDVGLTPKGRLVVSDAALQVFRRGNLDMCGIEQYDPETHT